MKKVTLSDCYNYNSFLKELRIETPSVMPLFKRLRITIPFLRSWGLKHDTGWVQPNLLRITIPFLRSWGLKHPAHPRGLNWWVITIPFLRSWGLKQSFQSDWIWVLSITIPFLRSWGLKHSIGRIRYWFSHYNSFLKELRIETFIYVSVEPFTVEITIPFLRSWGLKRSILRSILFPELITIPFLRSWGLKHMGSSILERLAKFWLQFLS